MIQTYTTRLVHKQPLAPDIYLFRFRLENGQTIQYKAGQYLILMVPQPDGQMARRLYSILTPPNQNDYFEMVIEILPNGVGSQYLMKLNDNAEVIFQGPAGVFGLRENDSNKIYLATGTGIAPIKSMIEVQCKSSPKNIETYLFWGIPTFKDLYFLQELKELTNIFNSLHVYICLSRETSFDGVPEIDRKFFLLGRVNRGFEEMILKENKQLTPTDYYVCGGRTVVESIRQYLYEKEIPRASVHFEKF
jgi:NAD(P)H-flavin reductase